MADAYFERRMRPRIKKKLKVGIENNRPGMSIDLSEEGVSFSAAQDITSPSISLSVNFPGGLKIKTKARIAWHRELEDKRSSYGVEFIGLGQDLKYSLRKELIKSQIQGLLSEIKDAGIKKQISYFFIKDLLSYIEEIIGVSEESSRQKEYSFDLQKKFNNATTKILLKGYCLELLFDDNKIAQGIKDNFRHLTGAWIYKSGVLKRAYEKPSGYPGDYKMLEIVYDNKPVSQGFGVYPDNCFLKSPYAIAVRLRKEHFKELLLAFINGSNANRINILNLACGSSREIKELLPELKTQAIVNFNFLDPAQEALGFLRDNLLPVKPKNVKLGFIKEDIVNLSKNENTLGAIGEQDLIYSLGLIDYLPDDLFKKTAHALYGLLKKGGRLVLTHKNREKTFPALSPDWLCDWKLLPRNAEEVVKLFYNSGLSGFSLSSEQDDFGYIYYFTIIK